MLVLAAGGTVMAAAVEVVLVDDTDVSAAQIDMALAADAAGGTVVAEHIGQVLAAV